MSAIIGMLSGFRRNPVRNQSDSARRTLALKQLAPVWHETNIEALAKYGLPVSQILIATEGKRVVGCLGVWNQQGFRQAVARGYPNMLSRLRSLVNLVGPLAGFPRLPGIGQSLRLATLSLGAVANEDTAIMHSLVSAALALALEMGLSGAIFGTARDNAMREAMHKRYRLAIEYQTELFLVYWPASADALEGVDKRSVAPELGFL